MTNDPLPEPLTGRELDILAAMVEGLSNATIAERLVLSTGTVKWYVKQLYGKLGAHSRAEAVSLAIAHHLAPAAAAAGRSGDGSDAGCPLINPLPQDISDRYLGNAGKLSQVVRLLEQRARLISVVGRAGSGKTALACKAVADLRRSARSGQGLSGVVSLSAAGTGLTLNRLFTDLGRLLHEKDQIILEGAARNDNLLPGRKIEVLLEQIAGKRIILLLDNLESIQNPDTGELNDPGLKQFIEMSVMQSSALTLLITSREPLPLPRALRTWEHLISLEDGLACEDAVALLRRFDPAGLAGLRDAPTEALAEIAQRLGGFPRALESVAGMLLEDPVLSLVDVNQTVDRLEGEISAEIVRQALAHLNREAMLVLGALAIFGRPVSYEALAYLASPFLSDSVLRVLLGRLVRACFVKTNRATGQVSLHPIDQAFCYDQIPAGEPIVSEGGTMPFARSALHRRVARYFHERRLPRSAWRTVADLEPQLNEFDHWVKAGEGNEAAQVLLEIDRDYLWEWEYKHLLRQLYPTLAGLVSDPHLAHQVARRQAWLKFFDGTDEAEQEFRRLLEDARRRGFVKEEAESLDDLAQIFRRGGRDARQAIQYHRRALELYRQLGDRRGEADALGGLGATLASIEPEEAIDYCLAAAEIQRELRNASSLSFVMSTLGAAYETIGSLEQARTAFEEAVEIAKAHSSLEALIRAYGHLAGLYILTGESRRADPLLAETTALTRQFTGLPFTGQLMFFIGRTAFYKALAGDFAAAIDVLEQAIHEAAAAQPHLAAFGNFFLSMVLMLGGEFQRARRLLPPEPQDLLERGIGNAYWIGVLLLKAGEPGAARAFWNKMLAISRPGDPRIVEIEYRDESTLPLRAVAVAGLALLNRDSALASEATALSRQMSRIRNWQITLHRALINLLIDEPGGEVLSPVLDALGPAFPRR